MRKAFPQFAAALSRAAVPYDAKYPTAIAAEISDNGNPPPVMTGLVGPASISALVKSCPRGPRGVSARPGRMPKAPSGRQTSSHPVEHASVTPRRRVGSWSPGSSGLPSCRRKTP